MTRAKKQDQLNAVRFSLLCACVAFCDREQDLGLYRADQAASRTQCLQFLLVLSGSNYVRTKRLAQQCSAIQVRGCQRPPPTSRARVW